jgi:hypothetical protein
MVIAKAAFLLSSRDGAELNYERTSESLNHSARLAQVRSDGRRCVSFAWGIVFLAAPAGMAMADHAGSDFVRSRTRRAFLTPKNLHCVDGHSVLVGAHRVNSIANPLFLRCRDADCVGSQAVWQRLSFTANESRRQVILVASRRYSERTGELRTTILSTDRNRFCGNRLARNCGDF